MCGINLIVYSCNPNPSRLFIMLQCNVVIFKLHIYCIALTSSFCLSLLCLFVLQYLEKPVCWNTKLLANCLSLASTLSLEYSRMFVLGADHFSILRVCVRLSATAWSAPYIHVNMQPKWLQHYRPLRALTVCPFTWPQSGLLYSCPCHGEDRWKEGE